MKHLKDNLLIQFSVISFVVMAVIAIALAVLLSNAIRSHAVDTLVDEAIADTSGRLLGAITPADLEVPMTGEHGENALEIKIPEDPENERERFLGTLMEVYTPIIFPGTTEPQGALEIYQYYQPTAQLINDLHGWVLVSISAGFMILYGSLVGNVWGGWRTIIRQREEGKRAEKEKENIQFQLRQAQKMEAVGRLAGGVAHDFNNLLTVITVGSDILLDEIEEDDPKHQDVVEIKKATERATSLTRQLLAFSHRQVLEMEVLNINSIMSDMEKMLSRLIGEDVQLETILDPKLSSIEADRGSIEQVIMNIVVNAHDAMLNGGKITLQTENVTLGEDDCAGIPGAKPGEFVRFSITDTGTGIDAETREHIFEPFFTTKAKGKGTGLGLSTVFGIVKQSGGWINVYSEPGQGSTFRIYLPVFSVGSEGKNKRIKELTFFQELHGNGERILLVEDEESIRAVAERLLTENGYLVFSAGTAEEALAIFNKEAGDFQLVLSDVVLPTNSGVELANQLLTLKPELHIVLSSGYANEKAQLSAIREKGYPFMQKPYTKEKLLHGVKENISRVEKDDEKQSRA
jgi:signal transduction histidine kinase/ActR/RegA family two-component response regulator